MSRHQPVLPFFLVSHGFSWTCWISAALLAGPDVWASPARWLVYLGGIGPMLAGIIMTYVSAGAAGLRDLGRRIVDPRRIPRYWLAIILLVPVLAMAGAVAVAGIAGDITNAVDTSRLGALLGRPLGLAGFALFVLIFGPVPEEVGWRGYALDALQAGRSAMAASLILGVAWALWHAPLFFIPGYYGAGGAPGPALFTIAILAHSVLYTWIHNHTSRSVLAAILLHFMVNFVGMLVEGESWVEWTRVAITAVLVLLVITWSHSARSRREV